MPDPGDTPEQRPTASPAVWDEIAESPEFARLEALRRRVTLGTLGIFTVAFGGFLVLCGYARPFMRRSVDGGLTVAYVWLLSLTVLTWVLVWVYLSFSDGRLGELAQRAIERRGATPEGRPGERPT